jgi:chromosome segregation ATPase
MERTQRIEASAERRIARLEELRKQWVVRRKNETERLAREIQRCRELQRLYTALREEIERRAMDLGAEQRSLAERTLAVEQLELEFVGQAEDAAVVEKRLQNIRKHISAQHSEAEKRLAERGRHLEEEAHRLSVQAQQLHHRLEAAAETEATLSSRQTEWEHRLTHEAQAREQLEEEAAGLRSQEQLVGQRCHDLQDELERLINALLQDAEPLDPPMAA